MEELPSSPAASFPDTVTTGLLVVVVSTNKQQGLIQTAKGFDCVIAFNLLLIISPPQTGNVF